MTTAVKGVANVTAVTTAVNVTAVTTAVNATVVQVLHRSIPEIKHFYLTLYDIYFRLQRM